MNERTSQLWTLVSLFAVEHSPYGGADMTCASAAVYPKAFRSVAAVMFSVRLA